MGSVWKNNKLLNMTCQPSINTSKWVNFKKINKNGEVDKAPDAPGPVFKNNRIVHNLFTQNKKRRLLPSFLLFLGKRFYSVRSSITFCVSW
jgi:hypothetical protein